MVQGGSRASRNVYRRVVVQLYYSAWRLSSTVMFSVGAAAT